MKLGFVDTSLAPPVVPYCRWPLWLGFEAEAKARYAYCLANAIIPILVLDRNSFKADEWANADYSARCLYWASMFPTAEYVEAGNEPDSNSPSSSYQTKVQLQTLVRICIMCWPYAQIIQGGLVVVDWNYLAGIDDLPSIHAPHIVALHPYAQTGATVGALVAAARQYTNKPLWATEFGIEQGTFGASAPGEHKRAQWFSGMLTGLDTAGVEVAIVYRDNDAGDRSLFWVAGTESEAACLNSPYASMAVMPAPTPPNPPRVRKGIDVANYQPQDLTTLIAETESEVVVVRLWLPDEQPNITYSEAQVRSARDNSCEPIGIVWPYRSDDPTTVAQWAVADALTCGLTNHLMCLDIEPYQGDEPDSAYLQTLDSALMDLGWEPVYYCSESTWGSMGTWAADRGRKLYAADYNGIADLESVRLFGGWMRSQVWGHQYAPGMASGINVDLDVFEGVPTTGAPTQVNLNVTVGPR